MNWLTKSNKKTPQEPANDVTTQKRSRKAIRGQSYKTHNTVNYRKNEFSLKFKFKALECVTNALAESSKISRKYFVSLIGLGPGVKRD